MRISAVLLARAVALVETYDLNPFGKVFYPDLIKALVERYRFAKFPVEYKDVNEQNGVVFEAGRHGENTIDRLTIFTTGIVVDTRSNTMISQRLIEEALAWAKTKFGLNYQEGDVKRFGYLSHLTFYSDIGLDALNPALTKLANRVGRAVGETLGENLEYQTAGVVLQHDPLKRKNPVAAFSIQPRVETPFPERKFFSEAPLSTDLHITLLREFEADVIASLPSKA